jgi:hypothetical protein
MITLTHAQYLGIGVTKEQVIKSVTKALEKYGDKYFSVSFQLTIEPLTKKRQ